MLFERIPFGDFGRINAYRLSNLSDCENIEFPHCDSSSCYTSNISRCNGNLCSAPNVICTSFCAEEQNCKSAFQCADNSLILLSQFCDGIVDCADGSDEVTNQPGFKCNRCVLPQNNLYDDVPHCNDDSDLCFADKNSCFQCLDKRFFISSKQVCDGVNDCFDFSDECLCEEHFFSEMCEFVFHENTCSDNALILNSLNFFNYQFDQNPFVVPEMRACAAKFGFVQATLCDGIPECKDFSDECDCKDPPRFCNDICRSFFLMGDRYCDGVEDPAWKYINNPSCPKGFDEKGCPKRFTCSANGKVNIDILEVCDGKTDCDDGSDERFCPSPNTQSIFSSETELIASPIIKVAFWLIGLVVILVNTCSIACSLKTLLENPKQTTAECSHELAQIKNVSPSPGQNNTESNSPNRNPTTKLKSNPSLDSSSKEETDGNPHQYSTSELNLESTTLDSTNSRPASLSFNSSLNSSAEAETSTNSIQKSLPNSNPTPRLNAYPSNSKSRSAPASKFQRILFLNISIADFIMGVYLLTIASYSAAYSGIYGLLDHEWRSSLNCSVIGSLAVFSSETSCFLMVILTAFKVKNEFKSNDSFKLKLWPWMLCIGIAWTLSFFLSLIPVFGRTSQYFMHAVSFPNVFHKEGTWILATLNQFLCRYALLSNTTISYYGNELETIENFLESNFPDGGPLRSFGYYGETSVCMPRIYVGRGERSWEYTLLLITLNFLGFIFIALGNVLIECHSSISPDSNKSAKIRKLILSILATDFFCWIPVCLLSYARLFGPSVPYPDIVYEISATLLLPLNSAVNPFLISYLNSGPIKN